MNMKNTNGTENIKAGQIWWNITNSTAIRITNIIPCTGVWGVTADGEGDFETISFDSIRKAERGEFTAFIERVRELRPSA